jgi:hypothetical protein
MEGWVGRRVGYRLIPFPQEIVSSIVTADLNSLVL